MTEAAVAVAVVVIFCLCVAARSVASEMRVRRQRAIWRALHPPPKADDEGDEEWASRVVRK